jgi:hypothetical protein
MAQTQSPTRPATQLNKHDYEIRESRLGGVLSWLLEELTGGRAFRAALVDRRTAEVLAEGIGSTTDEATRRAWAALETRLRHTR